MVEGKGIVEACLAAAQILPNFPDWHLHVVGGRHFQKSALSEYEQAVQKALLPIHQQSTQHGFMQGSDLAILQSEASIALVPSLWEEPAGLTVLEALVHGCALLTTDKGGIPETATGRAEIAAIGQFDRNAPQDKEKIITIFAEKLEYLLSHPAQVKKLQDQAWHNYPYDAKNMAVKADRYRLCINS
jgi:glycosyltransferase involved in cell wall biosynthesis